MNNPKIVTLSLLKFLEQNSLGKLDESLFWEKLGIGEDGIYITDLGGSNDRTTRPVVMYQIFCRGKDDLASFELIECVHRLLRESYAICNLPEVEEYKTSMVTGVTIMPPSTVSNSGEDVDGRIIWTFTGNIYYDNGYDIPEEPSSEEAVTTETNAPLLTQNNKVIIKE